MHWLNAMDACWIGFGGPLAAGCCWAKAGAAVASSAAARTNRDIEDLLKGSAVLTDSPAIASAYRFAVDGRPLLPAAESASNFLPWGAWIATAQASADPRAEPLQDDNTAFVAHGRGGAYLSRDKAKGKA
jgi:hypothetical protein